MSEPRKTEGKKMTANVTTKKSVYTLTQAKKDWAKVAQKEAMNANAIRASRASIVKKISDAGYSDTQIAKALGISNPEVGKLIAGAIAKKAGYDISATLVAIEGKGNGIEVGKIKGLAKKNPKVSDLDEALKAIGLTEKVAKGKRNTSTPTMATSTKKATSDLRKIAERAIAGKIGLAVIAETFEELLADMKAELMKF